MKPLKILAQEARPISGTAIDAILRYDAGFGMELHHW